MLRLKLLFFAWRYYLCNRRNGRGAQYLVYSAFAATFVCLSLMGAYDAYLGSDPARLLFAIILTIAIVVVALAIFAEFLAICYLALCFAGDALQHCQTKPEIVVYYADLYPTVTS